MTMCVFTFLERLDFTGTTIRPFCTHEGSGTGRSEADIKRLCPVSEAKKGLALRGGSIQNGRASMEISRKELTGGI